MTTSRAMLDLKPDRKKAGMGERSMFNMLAPETSLSVTERVNPIPQIACYSPDGLFLIRMPFDDVVRSWRNPFLRVMEGF